ncbi:MAG: hypothetical protein AAB367_03915 [Patescibacteria group bacterium]
MTDDQIDKAVDDYRFMLREHRDEIGSAGKVLGWPDYLAAQLALIRKHVQAYQAESEPMATQVITNELILACGASYPTCRRRESKYRGSGIWD